MEKKFLDWCEKKSVQVVARQKIAYGVQFKLCRGTEKASLSIFTSGKNLVQAKEHGLKHDILIFLGKPAPKPTSSSPITYKASEDSLDHGRDLWIGIDESGKGDFFGPLVACGVVVSKKLESQLLSLGVKDSKKLSDDRIGEMAPQLMGKLNYFCNILVPEDYNKEYDRTKNLNHLLAELHLDCAKNLYDDRVELIISDQFAADKSLLESYFSKNELPTDKLLQVPRAEEDLAVACASIIARFKFVEGIQSLSHNFGTDFPKGAGAKVDQIAFDFYSSFGIEQMKKVCKTHFKTLDKVVRGV